VGPAAGSEDVDARTEMSRAPRVVLDTNLVLSALVFTHGHLAALRRAWHGARCHPLVSPATVSELMRALTYPKFTLSPEQQRELLADYLPFCVTVRMPNRPPKTPACRDPFDLPFLQLAIVGKADYLATGDQDLLTLASKFSRPIVTADQLLATLAKG
jgi:putative PIN family toxin of toxin-antitoxin system